MRDVNENPAANSEFRAMGLQGVPAFKIGEDVIVGLDTEKILKAVDYQVVNCPSCKGRMRVPKGKEKIRVTCPHCSHQYVINTGK